MSKIDGKPYILTVLEKLSASELTTLRKLVNGEIAVAPVFRSLIPSSSEVLTASDKGIKAATIELAGNVAQKLYNGFLCYNNSVCALISYVNSATQSLSMLDLSLDDNGIWHCVVKNCSLSITELRSELDDLLESHEGGDDSNIYEVDNITSISGDILSALKAGDVVLKIDSTGAHSYRVSYKKDNTGICLTYSDASCVETVSYDYTAGAWVYNSTDITSLSGGGSGDGVKVYKGDYIGDETKFTPEFEVGDIIIDTAGFVGVIKEIKFNGDTLSKLKVSGLENNEVPTTYIYENSNWTDQALEVEGGTQLYEHFFSLTVNGEFGFDCKLVTTFSTPITAANQIQLLVNNSSTLKSRIVAGYASDSDYLYGTIAGFITNDTVHVIPMGTLFSNDDNSIDGLSSYLIDVWSSAACDVENDTVTEL